MYLMQYNFRLQNYMYILSSQKSCKNWLENKEVIKVVEYTLQTFLNKLLGFFNQEHVKLIR